MPGTLFLCGTPIGNLEDMTFRAVRILQAAAVIAAEDTRHTQRLLNHFAIHTPLVSYHEHNKAESGQKLIERLLAGEDVAVVSDAGMPGISDPGAHLVAAACENNIKIVPVPGACAALAGLVCSGIDTASFLFAGFLNRTKKKRRSALAELAEVRHTLIFYEAPHRLVSTLEELSEFFCGERRVVAARELTKLYEEFRRGTLAELLAHFRQTPPRGEFTLIIAGKAEALEKEQILLTVEELIERVDYLVSQGLTPKEARKKAAKEAELPKRDLYRIIVEEKAKKNNCHK